MKPMKVDVLVVLFAYGGNGGFAGMIPELALWMMYAGMKMRQDERIDRVKTIVLADTPITMTRNRAIDIAQQEGYDFVLMLDSDNEPDGYLESDPQAKPFWDEAFGFAYERLLRGQPTVVAAPYCGPPPHPVDKPGSIDFGEVPYLFEWMDNESNVENPQRRLEMLTRNEAARLRGIYPVAALPTGCSLHSTSAYAPLKKPYYDYEWNESHSEKHSTEDVFATRNISLYWKMQHDIDVVYATCDSWALHYKCKRVGKPRTTPIEVMSRQFRDALADPVSVLESKRYVNFDHLPRRGQTLSHDQDQVYLTDEDLEHARQLCEMEAAQAAVDADLGGNGAAQADH